MKKTIETTEHYKWSPSKGKNGEWVPTDKRVVTVEEHPNNGHIWSGPYWHPRYDPHADIMPLSQQLHSVDGMGDQ